MPQLPISLDVQVGEGFAGAIATLRQEADIGLAREVTQRVEDAVRPLPQAARDHAMRILPGSRHPGGLGEWLVNRTQITQSAQTEPWSVKVTVTATSAHDIGLIDSGTVRHPLFGDRRYWFAQRIKPGWWSDPVKDTHPAVETAVEQAVSTVADRIER